MRWFQFALVCVTAVAAAAGQVETGLITLQGEIRNLDGDLDGQSDDLKISRILFDVTAGTTVVFDSLVWESTNVDLNGDGFITGFDNYMRLLTNSGTGLTENDDYGTGGALNQNGSVHGYDSVISYTFLTGGTYMLAVGQLSYSAPEAVQGFAPNRMFSDYTVRGQNWGAWTVDIRWDSGSVSNVRALDDLQVSAVPEPASLAIWGIGAIGLAITARRRKQMAA